MSAVCCVEGGPEVFSVPHWFHQNTLCAMQFFCPVMWILWTWMAGAFLSVTWFLRISAHLVKPVRGVCVRLIFFVWFMGNSLEMSTLVTITTKQASWSSLIVANVGEAKGGFTLSFSFWMLTILGIHFFWTFTGTQLLITGGSVPIVSDAAVV